MSRLTMYIALSILLFGMIIVYASPTSDAINNAMKATYIQSGIKDDIDNYGKCVEHRYIDKNHERYWAAFVYIADSLYHAEIKFKFTF